MIRNIETNQKWNGEDVKIKMDSFVAKSLLEAGIKVEGLAVSQCPVDKGNLRGTITTQLKNDEHKNSYFLKVIEEDAIIEKPTEDNVALVGTACSYAAHQEYGTIKMKPQPYMRPALDLCKGQVLTVFEIEGKKEFKEYFDEYKQGLENR